jgi:tetratricopeptide (TPR) repeat protein
MLRVQLVKESEAVLRQAVALFPDSREVRYALAVHYAKAGMIESAASTLERASQLEGPSDPGADREELSAIYESLARMRKLLAQSDEALSAYETSLKLNPNNLESHLGLADLYFRRGLADDSLVQYQYALSISPENAPAYRGLAEVELSLDHFSESIAAAQRAVELDPAERKSRYIQAIALMRAGRIEEGKLLLEQYERLETEALAAQRRQREILELNRRAAATLAEGGNEEAINLYRKALEAKPDRTDEERIYLNLGLALAKQGRHQEAAQPFQTMITRGSNDFLIHRNLAVQYDLLRDPRALEQRAIYLQKYDAALKAILK